MKYSTKHHKYTPRTLEKHNVRKEEELELQTPLMKIQTPSLLALTIKN